MAYYLVNNDEAVVASEAHGHLDSYDRADFAEERLMTLTFGTLGPEGSNHDWVAQRYLAFHRLHHADIELFTDFDEAFVSF